MHWNGIWSILSNHQNLEWCSIRSPSWVEWNVTSRGVYFRGSSCIRLIILRSILLYYVLYLSLYIHYRIILSTIKFLGSCLCPLCTCAQEKVRELGTKADDRWCSVIRVDSKEQQNMVERAREWIFQHGRAVISKAINKYLGFSIIPVRVIPSPGQENILLTFLLECILSSTMWSRFQMFAPDLLHEFELGVWKHVFTHLVQILYACNEGAVQVLNEW
jgi:hypothetical protein